MVLVECKYVYKWEHLSLWIITHIVFPSFLHPKIINSLHAFIPHRTPACTGPGSNVGPIEIVYTPVSSPKSPGFPQSPGFPSPKSPGFPASFSNSMGNAKSPTFTQPPKSPKSPTGMKSYKYEANLFGCVDAHFWFSIVLKKIYH